ncbi:hypothetical protein GF415_05450 [Candidatus Micrarchaeota archaeon]|nr:hypothetical protein [Candidatus Micrarchaeota archaeon]
MEQKRKINPNGPYGSNAEAKGYFFKRDLEENKKQFSKYSLSFLIAAVGARRNVKWSMSSKSDSEFISSNFIFCFSHLGSRLSELSNIKEDVAASSVEVLSCKNGQMVFSWAMEHAIRIAEEDSTPDFAHTISLLFAACAKVCRIKQPTEMDLFFSAVEGLPVSKSKKLLKVILDAETPPDIFSAISIAYSEVQQREMSTSHKVFSGSTH